ncbi:MAG: DmsC/YnfH family molybdoenzyme membrane anchor subunit [Pseudomonadota bacterium]
MQPTFSVIFFTVSSGAGFGLFALLVLADFLKPAGGLGAGQSLVAGALALLLVAGGLVSSLFHLANPRNAWRAFGRFRTSWLSREGVFAMAFFPPALLYTALAGLAPERWVPVRHGVGLLAALLAWLTLFSSGMIYACLKTVRQWHTPLTPVNYLALGHFSGAMLLLPVAQSGGSQADFYRYLALGLLVVAAAFKAASYYRIAGSGASLTLNAATGLIRGQVRLLDAGHTHGTFLTREFGFLLARRHAVWLRAAVFVLGFALPLALLLRTISAPAGAGAAIAGLSTLLGIVAERWLFFAEARHVVNLYHGAQRG